MNGRALITGGAHPAGIGYGVATSLAEVGYEVTVTGYSPEEIALTPSDRGIRTALLDVRSQQSVDELLGRFDELDVLVNCAGGSNMQEHTPEGFERTIDINLNGTMRTCFAAKAALTRRRGAVVNVGSIYSTRGSEQVPAYSASKGGVRQLTMSLARAWARDGVRVNAIAPGWIETGMTAGLRASEQGELIEKSIPMGRWGTARECGEVIAFLCSEAARYVTGVMIPVDGGYLVTG